MLQKLVVLLKHPHSLVMNEPANIAGSLDTSSVLAGRIKRMNGPEEFENLTIFAAQFMSVLNTVKRSVLSLGATFKKNGNPELKMTSVYMLLIRTTTFIIDLLHSLIGVRRHRMTAIGPTWIGRSSGQQ